MMITMKASKSGTFPSCQTLFQVLFRNCIIPTVQRENSVQGGEAFAQLWESGCEIRRTSSSTLAWKIPLTEEPGGCSLRGREESDTTERLPFHFSLSCIGEGNGNPLQCSCLENPRDGGIWWASVCGVAESRTRLKRLSSSSSSSRACHHLNSTDPRGAEKEVSGTQRVCRVLPGKHRVEHQLARAGLFKEPRWLHWRVGHELGEGFGFWVWLLQRTR